MTETPGGAPTREHTRRGAQPAVSADARPSDGREPAEAPTADATSTDEVTRALPAGARPAAPGGRTGEPSDGAPVREPVRETGTSVRPAEPRPERDAPSDDDTPPDLPTPPVPGTSSGGDAPSVPGTPSGPGASTGAGLATAAAASAPDTDTATADAGRHRRRRRRWLRGVGIATVTLLVLGLGASTVYLYRTTTAWQDRADTYLADARGIGGELATTRAELAGTEAELEGVRSQLATAQARIVELADEKAQLGDDREVQRQLADYQERVSDAAGQVALALDQCVQGQQQLIGYLESTVTDAAQYDPAELERFRTDVEALCQAATEANIALQRELSR
ncbi:hypothetical protein [Cellulomonas carbonis]|nr:hypothetical protein [Cellulomonas carbonis]GGB96839.1 hypothetical protein GCM10010972_06990 [Cellulomonas carbonis]